jgi:histidinol dehydrogenase
VQIIQYPSWADADAILARPSSDMAPYRAQVAPVLADVKQAGDEAIRRYTLQFDRIQLSDLQVSADSIAACDRLLSPALKSAIEQAYANIRRFHLAQVEHFSPVETMPGVLCYRKSIAIERVGLYIPGGSAPLFSTVLMLGVPAQIAGCEEVVLCSPPQADGTVHPAVLFAARLCGIRQIYRIGGAQAIAAMAYGTATIPKVWKIFGPGNPWVTAAKQWVSLEGTAIDMPAGPSEVAIVADNTANPAFVAADLLSQAEHGPDSQVMLMTNSPELVQSVQDELETQLKTLPRSSVATQALAQSKALVVNDLEEAMAWANAYACEHLLIQTANASALAEKVKNAGSVFVGHLTPESAGDYASGTNHTLPTNGYARMYAGVSVDSFVRKVTFQAISPDGLKLVGPVVVEMATAEGLDAHANAVKVRLNHLDAAPPADVHPAAHLLRPNIARLSPYSSARDEFKTVNGVLPADFTFLDANENSLGSPTEQDFSRYPDPLQRQLKGQIAQLKYIQPDSIFLGNGSDEAIDLLIRAFCVPGRDNIVVMPPTYGMYQVQADIQDVQVRRAPLNPDFSPNIEAVRAVTDAQSKLLFICSPNNPTGNLLDVQWIETVLKQFPGIVVIDEAYIDFADTRSWMHRLDDFPRLVVLQTFSKAWGLAALRLGMAISNPFIINYLNKIKYPYNINVATAGLLQTALLQHTTVLEKQAVIVSERERVATALRAMPGVQTVFPSDANFLLVRTPDANGLYQQLIEQHLVVRNRTRDLHCADCLRLTIGQSHENDRLLAIYQQNFGKKYEN